MANKHIKTNLTSLLARKTQIKTTPIDHYYIPTDS